MKLRTSSLCPLVAALLPALSFLACDDATVATASGDAGVPKSDGAFVDVSGAANYDPAAALTFDPNDPNATFEARLFVVNRFGKGVRATLTVDGVDHLSDSEGLLTIPKMRVANTQGQRIVAAGYMPRPVRVRYATASGSPLRVVLEEIAVSKAFEAKDPAILQTGPMLVALPGGGYRTADGKPYTGRVEARGFGIDPAESVVTVVGTSVTMRKDFDPDRIPQGYLDGTDRQGRALDYLPESIFQVELTTDTGAPLSLDPAAPATYRFALSSFTQKQKGEIVPTFRFSEPEQRWVEAGTCVVQPSVTGNGLECMGQTASFSAWSLPALAGSAAKYCSTYKPTVLFDRSKYPSQVLFPDKTPGSFVTRNNPEVVEITSAHSKADVLDPERSVGPDVDKATLSVVSRTSWVGFSTSIALLRKEESGRILRDVYAIDFANSDAPVRTGRNVALITSYQTAASYCGMSTGLLVDLSKATPFKEEVVYTPPGYDAGPPDSGTTLVAQTLSLVPNACSYVKAPPGTECVPPNGTIVCTEPGHKYVDATKSCELVSCPIRYEYSAALGTCVLSDACARDNGGCSEHATCVNAASGTKCECRAGYHGDGLLCLKNNLCMADTCKNNGQCTDLPTGGYQCACAKGFSGTHCEVDENECLVKNGGCDERTTCTNIPGGRMCGPCPAGMTGTGETGCREDCGLANGGCDKRTTCTNSAAGVVCAPCPLGFAKGADGKSCVDVDECAERSAPCDFAKPCTNTEGGYLCTCASGYERSGESCVTQRCPAGYRIGPDGKSCVDVDECAEQTAPCDYTKTCINTPGGYSCTCALGYASVGNACVAKVCSLSCQAHAECVLGALGEFECRCQGESVACPGSFLCHPKDAGGYTCTNPALKCALTNPCMNGGTCSEDADAGVGYRCACPSGFYGSTCELRISACEPTNPCKNGGVCAAAKQCSTSGLACTGTSDCTQAGVCSTVLEFSDGGATGQRCTNNIDLPCTSNADCIDTCLSSKTQYECTCPAGTSGTNCEVNVDDCASMPCLNGGTCTDGIGRYYCSCPTGYSGSRCETAEACTPNPCEHGGICYLDGNDYYCDCGNAGYSGDNCEVNIDDCDPNPCQHGGTCQDGVNSYSCSCAAGYTGNNCQTNIDDCVSHNCQNGATCVDGVNGYTCSCASGWTGTYCADVNYCVGHGCLNGATCVNGQSGYTCSCAAGYSGALCGTNIDDCDPNPCQNGGTCQDGVNSFTCACASGWAGTTCGSVDYCDGNSCANGSTCVNGQSGYTCTCGAGYAGTYCSDIAASLYDCDLNGMPWNINFGGGTIAGVDVEILSQVNLTLNDIQVHVVTETSQFDSAIYLASDGSLLANSTSTVASVSSGDPRTLTFSYGATKPILVAGVTYRIAFFAKGNVYNNFVGMDVCESWRPAGLPYTSTPAMFRVTETYVDDAPNDFIIFPTQTSGGMVLKPRMVINATP